MTVLGEELIERDLSELQFRTAIWATGSQMVRFSTGANELITRDRNNDRDEQVERPPVTAERTRTSIGMQLRAAISPTTGTKMRLRSKTRAGRPKASEPWTNMATRFTAQGRTAFTTSRLTTRSALTRRRNSLRIDLDDEPSQR